MKILSTEQIREADAYTIEHEPTCSLDLMERAANACVVWLTTSLQIKSKVHIFCGLGNNGGDGLAIARLLAEKKHPVCVYIIRYATKHSSDFEQNEKLLRKIASVSITDVTDASQLEKISIQPGEIIIDAIFGSGLNKAVEGLAADTIKYINKLSTPVIAIDLPSGLFGSAKQTNSSSCIKAFHTLTFQTPKLQFMFPQFGDYIGDFTVLDIGLNPSFIAGQETINYFVTLDEIKSLIKPRRKFSHKGTYGHALVLAGSYGKMGAAVLASKACLRSGAGLVTAHIPACGYEILQTALPEVMTSIDSTEHSITELPKLESYNVIGIGPGLGNEKQTQNIVKLLLQNAMCPIVFDADALNILAQNKTWLAFLPKNSILTPHPKELERLIGKTESDYERYDKLREFAFKHGVYVVLKGAHTAVACPDATVSFNSTGNPGMATAGSGDVLTGIITGLLSQGYHPKEAAVVGVYWHGLAGDIALDTTGGPGVIASDIIDSLGHAYKTITD